MGAIDGGTGRALILTAALLTSGCARVGEGIESTRTPYARSAVIEGEIRGVDARRGRMRVRTGRRGTRTVRFDGSTRVLYRRVEYTVGALEPGDAVRVFVHTDASGTAWADRVDVRASVDERRDSPRRTARPREYHFIEGQVVRSSPEEGWFTLLIQRQASPAYESEVVVYVPDELDDADESRLGRLKRGDRVFVEVRPITDDEAELLRFRG